MSERPAKFAGCIAISEFDVRVIGLNFEKTTTKLIRHCGATRLLFERGYNLRKEEVR